MSKKQAFKLYDYLNARRGQSTKEDILTDLNISNSTFKRALAFLRARGLTIFPPTNGGYRLDKKSRNKLKLAGELLTPLQLSILLKTFNILKELSKFNAYRNITEPLLDHLAKSIGVKIDKPKYIDIIHQQVRFDASDNFAKIATSLEKKLCIDSTYKARTTISSSRNLSPQRLVFYRSNWYLIAWCHTKKALRTFAVERFTDINIIEKTSTEHLSLFYKNIDEKTIDAFYKNTYGIFGGTKTATAILIFDKQSANWVKDENWHQKQVSKILADGRLQLEIPIGKNTKELSLDLMRYGAGVEVLSPTSLKESLRENHKAALATKK